MAQGFAAGQAASHLEIDSRCGQVCQHAAVALLVGKPPAKAAGLGVQPVGLAHFQETTSRLPGARSLAVGAQVVQWAAAHLLEIAEILDRKRRPAEHHAVSSRTHAA